MKIEEFYYEIPKDLIAQRPAQKKSQSRLLVLDVVKNRILHKKFSDITEFFNEGDVLVLNDTQVQKARVVGNKITGGKVELLFFKNHALSNNYLALVKGKVGEWAKVLVGNLEIEIKKFKENFYVVNETDDIVESMMSEYGMIPLPPYIKRKPEKEDEERYQTIFARKKGSIASPTASLHFQDDIVLKLKEKGVIFTFLTLHVGPGTFLPIKVSDVESHNMLPEYCEISEETANTINNAIRWGKNVLFCGTTVVRAIEWASKNGIVEPKKGYADIFIYPGYTFKIVRNVLTNFHLPGSTPLLLVCALAGKDRIFKAYNEAISLKYRFFSYGDAMLIWKR
jgi:S-adenosylmethionine:tRNA ribosyltransferase-isomerase